MKKAIQSRLTAVRRTEGALNKLIAFAIGVFQLALFPLLLLQVKLEKEIGQFRRTVRDWGLAWAFVRRTSLAGILGAVWLAMFVSRDAALVMAAFAVANNDFYTGTKSMPQPADSGEVCIRVTASITGTGAVNDVIKLARLPADCVVTGWELDADDLDSGTNTLAVDFGILNAAETAVSAAAGDGGKWLTGSTGLTAAPSYVDFWNGTAAEKRALLRMSPSSANRSVGLVVTVAGNAAAVASAVVGLSIWYRPAAYGQ